MGLENNLPLNEAQLPSDFTDGAQVLYEAAASLRRKIRGGPWTVSAAKGAMRRGECDPELSVPSKTRKAVEVLFAIDSHPHPSASPSSVVVEGPVPFQIVGRDKIAQSLWLMDTVSDAPENTFSLILAYEHFSYLLSLVLHKGKQPPILYRRSRTHRLL